jgi:hypothetical protein
MARVTLLLITLLAVLAAPASAQIGGTSTLTTPPGCDPIDPAACLLPWPNDFYTKADPSTATGKRLNLLPTSTPRNIGGRPVDVLELNRHDGFSPGSAVITKVPGLDTPKAFENSRLVPEGDMDKAFAKWQPAVVIDADTGKRQLIWAELDLNHLTEQKDRVLIIRPGKNWEEGHRYIVALRNLKDTAGRTIQPNETFKAYRDKQPLADPRAEARRPHMEDIFTRLGRAKISRDDLYLAWDFTVASERDRSERILFMRDAAFGELGDSNLADLEVEGDAPEFTVDSVSDQSDGRRKVTGTFTVPCFLDKPGCVPGSKMAFAGPNATLPTRIPGNTQKATYTCFVPRDAINGGPASRPSLYGHGLLGGQGEVGSGPQRDMVTRFNMTYCATDWYGFATEDLGSVALTLLDASNFPLLADRMQQGILAFHFLGRLAIHPQGFSSDPAFQRADGSSAIDTTGLYYDGNSQGGIMGGAVVATSPDATRGVLGVPAMNYSTLLQRSTDFESKPDSPCPPTDPSKVLAGAEEAAGDPSDYEGFLSIIGFSYACPLYASYPSVVERQLLFGLMQQLWDRGEANGYAQHMTADPLPNTPAHEVLLHVALGDHQVAQVAAEVEARTIGARIRPVAVDADRTRDVTAQYGIPKIGAWPYKGSALEIWDSGPIRNGGAQGNDVAPHGTIPNRPGKDPHGDPRSTTAAQFQKSAFFQPGGLVEDHCAQFHAGVAGRPCYSRGWRGATGW